MVRDSDIDSLTADAAQESIRLDNPILHWPNDPTIAGCNQHCHRAEAAVRPSASAQPAAPSVVPDVPADLAEWNAAFAHAEHDVDSNDFCNDCMRFIDTEPPALAGHDTGTCSVCHEYLQHFLSLG
jgi:hypothetical protein